MPALSSLRVVSPKPVELHASRPAAHLTSLTLRILYDQTLCVDVQQHLSALRRLKVQPLCGRCYRRDESMLHLDGLALSCLQALTVGAEQVCTVTAAHPLPALTELTVAHGDCWVGVFAGGLGGAARMAQSGVGESSMGLHAMQGCWLGVGSELAAVGSTFSLPCCYLGLHLMVRACVLGPPVVKSRLDSWWCGAQCTLRHGSCL